MLTDTRDHQEGPTQTAGMPASSEMPSQIKKARRQAEFALRPNVPGQRVQGLMILALDPALAVGGGLACGTTLELGYICRLAQSLAQSLQTTGSGFAHSQLSFSLAIQSASSPLCRACLASSTGTFRLSRMRRRRAAASARITRLAARLAAALMHWNTCGCGSL